jgi:predicted RNA-binding Zn-ribbon protein involved in translation (DUF1610 family)
MLENLHDPSHNRVMASGIWTTEYFSCPNCGLPYTATREQHPDKRTGSFSCDVCASEVHAWSGQYDFFDWKVDQASSPVFGKRWGVANQGTGNG